MESATPYMKRAFDLALLGTGRVSPNPLVGCVIIKDDRIIGEGYHRKYGASHAEADAINSIEDHSLLKDSLVVVSLEPCAHHGKTPPCADLLIKNKIGKLIISNIDPNPLVAGKGLRKIEEAGIKVQRNLLREEGAFINRRFFTKFIKKRPYIILKWAQTSDGFIARENHDSKWISNSYSRKLVHKWRMEEDAILVGTDTAHYDNPRLDTRNWPIDASSGLAPPVRIIIDRNLRLNPQLHLFNRKQKTVCFNCCKNEAGINLEYVQLKDDNTFLNQLLAELHSRQIQSLIVEGGANILSSFIKQGLWDEARVMEADCIFGTGIAAPAIAGSLRYRNKLLPDTLSVFNNS